MSLRLRLLLGLIAISAVGLAVFGIVSYRSLESYLTDRVDRQVESAIGPVGRSLIDDMTAARSPLGPAGGGAGLPVPPGDLGPGQEPDLPPGTYGQIRDSSGKVIARTLISYGESGLPRPDLPATIPTPAPGGDPELITVGSLHGGSTDFRVMAVTTATAATMIVAVPLREMDATLSRLALIELIVAAAVLIAIGGLAWWVIRLGLRPLERMERTAGEIAAGDLTRRVEPAAERTEVGRLGLALNSMLGQIEKAFAQREESEGRMRQFLADASHELRTPLAAIRGYAELFRLGATEDPEDVARSMDRIEQESQRMSGLVDDLLTLARMDSIREPVLETVDLASVVEEACGDARAAAPEREITLSVLDPKPVTGDPDQLRQVVVNLISNAATHTPAGTGIEVTLQTAGESVELIVRDHGPGLGTNADGAIFERFWRDSQSRGRDSGGSGLGLAIVSAIVTAHDGEVSASDASGCGAIFTVRLPAST